METLPSKVLDPAVLYDLVFVYGQSTTQALKPYVRPRRWWRGSNPRQIADLRAESLATVPSTPRPPPLHMKLICTEKLNVAQDDETYSHHKGIVRGRGVKRDVI
ncbi:hypothetical protein PoB_002748100 [Plakobranchus ocellatus]|uniref:Uncharacterized protein n=1 Tax=Plakobranchus ocellatus TaxID=259542 RepID=A0AAV4A2Q4_9GAST|nr:hypothetical protein PoB_002748100 [Plakobranchus ocellatus]